MANNLLKAGRFLKIVGEDNCLSLTNLAVIVVLVKLATTRDAIHPVDIGGLLATLLPYQAKKVIAKMKDRNCDEADPSSDT